MKASELRIGNWILTSTPGGHKGIMIPQLGAQVQGITLFGEVILCHTPQVEGFNMPVKHLAPIPLTEEWLIKFGFIKSDKSGRYGYIYKCGDIDSDWVIERDWRDEISHFFGIEYTDSPRPADQGEHYFFAYEIKYVHQLQNLYFALTGKELTIVPTEKKN